MRAGAERAKIRRGRDHLRRVAASEESTIETAARRLSAEESATQWTGRLLRLAHELAISTEPARAADLVAREFAELSGGGPAAVFLTEADGSLARAAAAGPFDPLARGLRSLLQRSVDGKRVLTAEHDELELLSDLGCPCAEALAAPIAFEGDVLGGILVTVPSGRQLGLHPGLLATVADLLAASVVNARRLASTIEEARRDPLTGLGNHRSFHEHLDGLLHGALVADGKLGLVLFDLDDLKRLNDEHGHAAGDRVLREVAGIVPNSFRIGGDEFAVVSERGTAEAARLADEMRQALAARGATCSAGVAGYPDDARTKDELVHKADLALYAAKRAGKNSVMAYGSDLHGAAARSRPEVMRAQLHERMGRASVRDAVVHELASVATAVRALGQATTLEAMLDAAARHLQTVLGATACVISRLDGDRVSDVAVQAPWAVEEGGAYLLEDYPETRAVIDRGEPCCVSLSDPGVDAGEAFVLRQFRMHANLMLPLQVGPRPWGLIEVFDARKRVFGPADVGLAELVAGQIEALLAKFEQGEAMQRLYYETLGSLSNALEAKDGYTSHHAQEVGDLSVAVGRRLGLDGEALSALEFGALLHDIGKIRVPESILNKPGPLTDAEWDVMRTHPEAGERILAPIASLADVVPIVRSSHERWDGRGYPDRLAGDAIPLGARVVSVCDAYRAMIEPRPYRAARDRDCALEELRANASTQFDPACVDALIRELRERERGSVLKLLRPDHVILDSTG
ncbi:MAG: HD domain-containing phosphohydrolase [Gaiellaceae bacterium]